MRAALLQMQPISVQANLACIERAAKAAAAFGASLLVTPEMGTTGYAIWDKISGLAEPRDGPIVQRLAAIAAAQNIAIIAGFPERDGNTVYNAAALVQPDGAKTIYRKCHLFGPLENAAFTPAQSLCAIVRFQSFNLGMLICYDVEFPEMVRSLVLAGADLICVPTALPRGPSAARVSASMIQTRAFENHVFIIYADLCGEENNTPYHGGSLIAAPNGDFLVRAGDTEALLIAELSAASYENTGLDPYLEDRRPAIYKL